MEKGSLPVISISQIVSIIKDVLPERELHQVIDHGIWVRHNFELVFNDGSKAFMKIQIQDEWLDLTVNESRLSEILRNNGLPGPETLYLEPQGENLGLPFIIQSALKGRHLSTMDCQVRKPCIRNPRAKILVCPSLFNRH